MNEKWTSVLSGELHREPREGEVILGGLPGCVRALVGSLEYGEIFKLAGRDDEVDESAKWLAAALNELDSLREQRRWRPIGSKPYPAEGEPCQLGNPKIASPSVWFCMGGRYWFSPGTKTRVSVTTGQVVKKNGTPLPAPGFTHWRPIPTDKPESYR